MSQNEIINGELRITLGSSSTEPCGAPRKQLSNYPRTQIVQNKFENYIRKQFVFQISFQEI